MFICENVNVQESSELLFFMREALIEQVGDNEDVVSFLESASDTDILSYAVMGKAAPKDIDSFMFENAMLSKVKDVVLENAEVFTENINIANFVNNIGSLQGIDSIDILSENETFMDLVRKTGFGSDKAVPQDWKSKLASGATKAWDATKDKAHEYGEKLQKGWEQVSQYAKDNPGKAIGAAALVGIASYVAYKAYQNYFSKAAKACAGKTGEAKSTCMAKAKQSAKNARIASLRKGMSMASKSANPSKARAALSQKIAALK